MTARTAQARLTAAESGKARGKAARRARPIEELAAVASPEGRDSVGLLLSQAESRVPELVPLRHSRMLESPFTFFRGAALPMAIDLGETPSTDLTVQLCGDAHLSNFGAFAAPDRRLVFDVNDFDETLPGPFEWDVKRLVASLEVAGRSRDFTGKERRSVVGAAAKSFQSAMRAFAAQGLLEVWYSRLEIESAVEEFAADLGKQRAKATKKLLAKAHRRDTMQALGKLTTLQDGEPRFVSQPPEIMPIEEVFPDHLSEAIYAQLREVLAAYGDTLSSDRRYLVNRFDLVQVARKVVGVGSVGTRAWVLLLRSKSDDHEPLLLQGKEAQASVLETALSPTEYDNQGERVVAGQHLMQAASDIFLGWQRVRGDDGVDRDFYVRQLRDWKFSAPIELMRPSGLARYAQLCGWTLARAHARSGDRHAIAAYLGKSDAFAAAMVDFATSYADLNDNDYAEFRAGANSGRVSTSVAAAP